MDFEMKDVSTRMKLHLNYGSAGHGYLYDLMVHDKIVGSRHVRRGKESFDFFAIGDEQYEVVKGDNDGLYKWMQEQLKETTQQPTEQK